MSTGRSAVMLCGWGIKAGRLIPYVDKRVDCGWQVKLCDPSLTRANLSSEHYRDEYCTHYKALYKCRVYLLTVEG